MVADSEANLGTANSTIDICMVVLATLLCLTWWKDYCTQDVLFTKAIDELIGQIRTTITQADADKETVAPIVVGLRRWESELIWASWVSKHFIPRLWFFGDPLNSYPRIKMLLPDVLERLQNIPDDPVITPPLPTASTPSQNPADVFINIPLLPLPHSQTI